MCHAPYVISIIYVIHISSYLYFLCYFQFFNESFCSWCIMFIILYLETAGNNGVLVPVSDDCEIISMKLYRWNIHWINKWTRKNTAPKEKSCWSPWILKQIVQRRLVINEERWKLSGGLHEEERCQNHVCEMFSNLPRVLSSCRPPKSYIRCT